MQCQFLQSDKICKDIYEFILWDNCNNNCEFCWQRQHGKHVGEFGQLNSIRLVKEKISQLPKTSKHILLVGGEIFDSRLMNLAVSSALLDLFDYIINLILKNEVELFYINTNLLYTDMYILKYLLDKIVSHGLENHLKFTTSYDIAGRYTSLIAVNHFFANLAYIRDEYPQINVVVNTILTKQCCEYILSGHSIVSDINNEYGYYVNLLPYIDISNKFTPTRSDIIKALQYEDSQNEGYVKAYVQNFDLPQNKILYRFVNGNLNMCSSDSNKCGHGINFARYSSQNTCFICDMKEFFNVG